MQDYSLFYNGLWLLLSGSILGIIYQTYGYIFAFFTKIFCARLDAIEWTLPFEYLKKFLEKTNYANTICPNHLASGYHKIQLTPSYGTHFFRFNNKWYKLRYSVESEKMFRREHITISTFSIFNKKTAIQGILGRGKYLYENEDYDETKVFTPNGQGWLESNAKKLAAKPVLNLKDDFGFLEKDINKFLESEKFYLDNGIPYKRTYLFYGEPGNGKSSCIVALAQYAKKHLAVLNIGSSELKESELLLLIANLPENSVLCLEDIDTASNSHERKGKKEDTKKKVSLGTILNILDGPHTPHGLLTFMTTNHIKSLDNALIRPGRVDIKYEFKNTNEYQANELFNRFISTNGHPDRQTWVNRLINKPVSEASFELFQETQKISS